MTSRLVVALWLVALGGCAAQRARVGTVETPVAGGRLTVKPESTTWSRLPESTHESPWEEVWTWSGSQLDRISLVGGLPEGKAIIAQDNTSNRQVPLFRAGMSPLDLASMLEVSYRINGVTVFSFRSIEPADFLGGTGIRLRYDYASGLGFAKQGTCLMRIVDGRLYAMKLEGVASRFDAVAPEFDRLAASARLRGAR